VRSQRTDQPLPLRTRRLCVEECHALDLAQLRSAGLWRDPGAVFVSTCGPHPLTGAVSQVAINAVPAYRPTALRLLDREEPDGGWGSGGAYLVPLDWTRPHFGGRRPWLRCPAQGCGRRVRILYRPLGAPVFACRRCHGLTYRARQLHRLAMFEGYERPEKVVRRFDRARSRKARARAARWLLRLAPNVERLRERLAR